jgi:glutaminyl-peptide cyclotransferase
MKSYDWIVEHDSFIDQTPLGKKSFTNIIATLPIGTTYMKNADKSYQKNHINNRVVIACHYDSKYFTNINFIGATDSAVPCAMLLDLAKYLKDILPNEPQLAYLGRHLQFIFFDGEEAFVDWTATDSIYGSRHYASLLSTNYSSKAFDTMDLFVLLDLIGGDRSQFLNYFPQTSHVYNLMAKIGKCCLLDCSC